MATADLSGVSLRLVDTVEKAGELMTWLGERRPVNALGIDTETGEKEGGRRDDAFSPWHGRLRLAQIGDSLTGWSIPWERWNGVFHEAMARYQGEVICHNIAFEAKWLGIYGGWDVPWHRAHDTMIASQVINPLMSAALKSLTSRFVDRRAAALQQLLDQKMVEHGWTWGTVPIDLKEYWSYGALDTVLTVRLWEELKPLLEPYKNVYDLEMGARRVCTRMEVNGARVDVEYSRAQRDRLAGHSESVRQWVKDTYKANAGSPSQMVRVFEGFGCVITETTPSGAPKLDKTQLRKFSIDHAGAEAGVLADQLLAMRKSAKLAGTYFDNFVTGNIGGIMHPEIRTMGARTARMSITNPALQTLPKRDKIVRKAFIPRNEEEILLTCDLEQVEFRMMAALCQDPALVALFLQCDATGEDAFTKIGRDVYGDPTMTKEDVRRAMMKTYVYGTMYGAGIATSAVNAGVPEARMREVAASFNGYYPGVKSFIQRVEHEGMLRLKTEGEAYVMTRFGRKLAADEGRVYTLVNYCLAPGTPVLLADLSEARADELRVGDALVGFDEAAVLVGQDESGEGGRWARYLRETAVEAVTAVTKPVIRVTVDDGRFVDCSNDHLWLVGRPSEEPGAGPSLGWVPADKLAAGDWLFSPGDSITEGFDGTEMTGDTAPPRMVVRLSLLGEQELVSVQTTTRTMVANGLATHNCIQGGAAEVFKLDILKADAAGLGEFMVVPVHDELVLSVPKKEAPAIAKVLQEAMTTRDGWEVPLLAGAPEAGPRWGDLSPGGWE